MNELYYAKIFVFESLLGKGIFAREEKKIIVASEFYF